MSRNQIYMHVVMSRIQPYGEFLLLTTLTEIYGIEDNYFS